MEKFAKYFSTFPKCSHSFSARFFLFFFLSFSSLILSGVEESFSQSLGLNNATPAASSILDITATNKGVLFPRMTTANRDAIASPATGLIIYNTDCNEIQYYNSLQWVSVLNANSLGTPTANAASSISNISFSANWTSVSGATTYYLDVSTNSAFSSFVSGYNNLDVGNVVTYSVTGLTGCTTYYYRVRAGSSCGSGQNSNAITATTAAVSLIAGSWTTSTGGYSFVVGAGSNRLLVLIAGMENNPDRNLTAVTYGGVAMTQGPEVSIPGGATESVRTEMWYLNEAGIASAVGTAFVFTWSAAPANVMYTAAAFANVNQTTPIGNTSTNSSAVTNPLPISSGAGIAVNACDMVVTGITSSKDGDFTPSAGYTEGSDFKSGSSATETSYKAILVDATVNPATTVNGGPTQWCTLGFQIKN